MAVEERSMRLTFDKLDELFRWRTGLLPKELDAQKVVDSLSVEGLPYYRIPSHLYETVVSFRHLAQSARLAKVRRWLATNKTYKEERRARLSFSVDWCARGDDFVERGVFLHFGSSDVTRVWVAGGKEAFRKFVEDFNVLAKEIEKHIEEDQ